MIWGKHCYKNIYMSKCNLKWSNATNSKHKLFKPIVAYWHQMATYILVNIGTDNGLSPEGRKLLAESMLIYHQ